MTLKAARLVSAADVIVDHLGAEGVLDLARPTPREDLRRQGTSNHALPQENQCPAGRAGKTGKRVVRLKGRPVHLRPWRRNHPWRRTACRSSRSRRHRGRQLQRLCRHPADTSRPRADLRVRHQPPQDSSVNLDWKALARPQQTVVFYMGIGGVGEICRQLMANRLPADHPAAVIQHGTSRRQRVVTADLRHADGSRCGIGIKPPALIIIGTVVSLQKRLAWFKPASAAPAQSDDQRQHQ